MKQARQAQNPSTSAIALKKLYESGDRSKEVLLKYAVAIRRENRNLSDLVAEELIQQLSDADLTGSLGWDIISSLGNHDEERLGAFLLLHKDLFIEREGVDKVNKKIQGIMNNSMFRQIEMKNEAGLRKRITFYTDHPKKEIQNMACHFECMFYLETGNSKGFTERFMGNSASVSERVYLVSKVLEKAEGGMKMDLSVFALLRLFMSEVVKSQPSIFHYQINLAKACIFLSDRDMAIAAAERALVLATNDSMRQNARKTKNRAENIKVSTDIKD